MLVFDQLWVVILLPLPWLIAYFSSAYKTRRDALRVPFFQKLVAVSDTQPGDGALVLRRNRLQQFTIALSWLLLIAALAEPQWLGEPIVKQQPARDLMLAVDLSGSMETDDFVFNNSLSTNSNPLPRLEGVKQVLKRFVAERQQDRLGLIVFGSAAYLQVPFTLDHTLFEELLSEVQTRMAGPKTMLGDAVGVAVKHFASSTSRKKVLILLTDGNDSGSLVPPADAARVARDQNIVIHTVAIGDPTASGEAALDMDSLQQMSRITGGLFFHATSGDQLNRIYQALNRLETQDIDITSHRPKQSLFHWPIAAMITAQLLTQLTLALTSWRHRRRHNPHHNRRERHALEDTSDSAG